MTVHHLNCLTMRPPSARLVNSAGSWLDAGRMVAHCLLIEGADSLMLVDAGVSMADCENPARLGWPFRLGVRPELDVRATAAHQITDLGLDPEDVGDIVLTHLDVDHAGGIVDFPDARVHVLRAEHGIAMAPPPRQRMRYRHAQWVHNPKWELHDGEGEEFRGMPAQRILTAPEVWLIPLEGHTRGHAAVAVRDGDGWLVHCGDAYFNRGELADPPTCPPGLQAFQTLLADDNVNRKASQHRIRKHLATDPDLELFSAHDPVEFDRLAGA